MVIEEINSIYLCVACVVAIVFIFYRIYIDVLKIKDYDRLRRRCDDIHDYMLILSHRDFKAYMKLPTFKEMLYSDKPLEDEYWINK